MLFSVEKNKKHIFSYTPIVLLLLVLILFVLFANTMVRSNTARERDILEHALDRSITQCYALEGMYPTELDYLEEHYGLFYNKEHFYVVYQYIGENLRPDITIIERE